MKFPIILLHDLKGAMRLHRSKDMSVHVSICTTYDFNSLTPVVLKLWHWWNVCVSTSRHKNWWLLTNEQKHQRADASSDPSSQFTNNFFSAKISMEMKHGAFNMTSKQTTKFAVQTANTPTTQKSSHAYLNYKWRQCSSLSSVSRVLLALNSFHKAKQLTKLIMWTYGSCYVELCVDPPP